MMAVGHIGKVDMKRLTFSAENGTPYTIHHTPYTKNKIQNELVFI